MACNFHCTTECARVYFLDFFCVENEIFFGASIKFRFISSCRSIESASIRAPIEKGATESERKKCDRIGNVCLNIMNAIHPFFKRYSFSFCDFIAHNNPKYDKSEI